MRDRPGVPAEPRAWRAFRPSGSGSGGEVLQGGCEGFGAAGRRVFAEPAGQIPLEGGAEGRVAGGPLELIVAVLGVDRLVAQGLCHGVAGAPATDEDERRVIPVDERPALRQEQESGPGT